MTPYQRRLSRTTRRMAEDMLVRNFAQATIDAYTYHVDRFLRFCGRPAEQVTPELVRKFQLHLIRERNSGWSSFNQAVSGIRFLYRVTVPRDWHVQMIPFGKRPKRLPAVLAQEQVERLLQSVPNHKHRTVLLTLYAAGLRINEALHLQAADIDSARMMLHVRRGKGSKQRCVPLSPRLLEALREYWKAYRPPTWLFPGKTPQMPLSDSTVQKVCTAAAREAKLPGRISPHTLRHSFATGLLEAGVDLLTIGQLLGHRSFTSTLVYLHVRRPHLNSVPSPIDWLPVRQCPQWLRPDDPGANDQPPESPAPA